MSSGYSTIPSSDIEDATHSLQQHFELGKQITQEKIAQLRKYAEEGNWTWKVLGFIAGLLMMANGVLSFLVELTSLSPLMAVLDIYMFCFGLICVLLEYKEQALTQKYINIIRREALFLYKPYGRGAFYMLCGSILLAKGGILSPLIGLFVCCIGLLLFSSSRQAQRSLDVLREQQFNDELMSAKFQEFDKNNDGYLNAAELAALCQALGSPLDYNSLEAAVLLLDKDGDGRIDYAEFANWWKGQDMF